MKKKKPLALIIHPVSPPWAGVEKIGDFLKEGGLGENFDVLFIKGNIRSSNAKKGTWDLAGIFKTCGLIFKTFFAAILKRPDVGYIPLSQNHSGLLRDGALALIFLIMGIPVFGHEHGSRLGSFLQKQRNGLGKFYLFFLRRLRRIFVCAKFIKKDLTAYFPEDRIVVIHNGVESPPKKKDNWTIGSEGPVFSFMGHLSRAKGFYDLLQAAEIFLEKGNVGKFFFAGERLDSERNLSNMNSVATIEKERWSYFERLSDRFKETFYLAGMVFGREKERFLLESDVFVFPSWEESFGLSAFEAMASGLPLITTPVGGMEDLFQEGENGWLVPKQSPEDLSAALESAAQSEDLRQKYGKKNIHFGETLSPARMTENIGAEIFKAL